MKVLGSNVLVLKQTSQYKGLIQGINGDDNTRARVMSIGELVTDVGLGDQVLIDWKVAKPVSGDLYLININDVIAVFEESLPL
jgi:hypothetical protein